MFRAIAVQASFGKLPDEAAEVGYVYVTPTGFTSADKDTLMLLDCCIAKCWDLYASFVPLATPQPIDDRWKDERSFDLRRMSSCKVENSLINGARGSCID